MPLTQRATLVCLYVCYNNHFMRMKQVKSNLMQYLSAMNAGGSTWHATSICHECWGQHLACNTCPPWMLGAVHGSCFRAFFALLSGSAAARDLIPCETLLKISEKCPSFFPMWCLLCCSVKERTKPSVGADSQDIHQAVVGTQIQTHPAERL